MPLKALVYGPQSSGTSLFTCCMGQRPGSIAMARGAPMGWVVKSHLRLAAS